jgi:NADH-quinone oxidoreductase subunit F
MTPNGDVDLARLDPVLEKYAGGSRIDLLPALHDTQRVYGYLPAPALERLGQTLRVPLADIHGVVEFYTMFYDEPVGERIIRVCTDPSCAAHGAEDVLIAACRYAGGIHPGETTKDGSVTVERVTCLGLCDQPTAALVDDHQIAGVTPDSVGQLFTADKSTSTLNVRGEPRILTRHIGVLDPLDLDAHREAGTFEALELAVTERTPEDVIETVKASELVGRGGAAFPTGLKWQFTRGAARTPKYVVVNADESEPGTFKDRVLMEGDPFRLIEGTALCGYAVGAEKGFIFLRGEYPEARRTLDAALDRCREAGLLGENVMGAGFSFDIELRASAGAYICGEETALFEAIEGKRGFPRVKPPFPTTNGLYDLPTAINNVETIVTVPDIILNGPEWFRGWGTEKSAGYKLFCVSGHVNQPSLVEAPFGVTLRDLVERWCGGFDGAPQAVLMGGAAGTFLTPDQLDVRLLYEDLRPLGASIGSGAIMVFNESVDLRGVLLRLAHFFAHESCGKCFPCQLGTQRQLEVVERAADGGAQPGDRDLLMDIGATMTDASICGLGQTAGVAVMSALKTWPTLIKPNGRAG